MKHADVNGKEKAFNIESFEEQVRKEVSMLESEER